MPKFEFKYFENADTLEKVRAVVLGLPDIWPSYAYEVYVFMQPCPHEAKPMASAECDANPDYKRVVINIYPPFLAEPESIWARNLIEEVRHSLFGNFDAWFQGDVIPFIQDINPALAKVFTQQYLRHWEQFTNELVAIDVRNMKKPRVETAHYEGMAP